MTYSLIALLGGPNKEALITALVQAGYRHVPGQLKQAQALHAAGVPVVLTGLRPVDAPAWKRRGGVIWNVKGSGYGQTGHTLIDRELLGNLSPQRCARLAQLAREAA